MSVNDLTTACVFSVPAWKMGCVLTEIQVHPPTGLGRPMTTFVQGRPVRSVTARDARRQTKLIHLHGSLVVPR